MESYKILDCYAGVGGNRKLWDKPLKEMFGDNYEITAVEYNQETADIYQDFFPNDKMVVGDAHQYLLDHYKEFDFIWASPPCQSHSKAYFGGWKNDDRVKDKYPDMSLYQEILFIKNWFNGWFVIENVKPYYDPLINPDIKIGRHLFWSNIKITNNNFKDADINRGSINDYQELHGFDLSKYKLKNRKDQILRNCVNPEIGLHFLNRALDIKTYSKIEQLNLFDEKL